MTEIEKDFFPTIFLFLLISSKQIKILIILVINVRSEPRFFFLL